MTVCASYPFHYDMPSQRISDSEIVVQKQCLDMIAKLFRRCRVAAVPNGTHIASKAGRGKAKREGRSPGFPDLIITGCDYASRPLSAYVEIKAKEPLSAEQKDWMIFLVECNHFCGVFRSDRTLELKMREWGFV
jgi:hypothetical protein